MCLDVSTAIFHELHNVYVYRFGSCVAGISCIGEFDDYILLIVGYYITMYYYYFLNVCVCVWGGDVCVYT